MCCKSALISKTIYRCTKMYQSVLHMLQDLCKNLFSFIFYLFSLYFVLGHRYLTVLKHALMRQQEDVETLRTQTIPHRIYYVYLELSHQRHDRACWFSLQVLLLVHQSACADLITLALDILETPFALSPAISNHKPTNRAIRLWVNTFFCAVAY